MCMRSPANPSDTRPSGAPLLDFGDIADGYDLILSDIWGVLHNGVSCYKGTEDALRRFRSDGGAVILVSNSPRPYPSVREQLKGVNARENTFCGIISSGDLARKILLQQAGEKVFYIGPSREMSLFDDMDVQLTTLPDAGLIVCAGVENEDHETELDYRDILEQALGRNLPMLCANPDLVAYKGDHLITCGGSVALLYETMGGHVEYTGKPYSNIYEAALTLAEKLKGKAFTKKRTLAIGDAIRTDIAGATRFGIDSLMVIDTGIHSSEIGADVQSWLGKQEFQPSYFMNSLVWL